MLRSRGRSIIPVRAFVKENFGEHGWRRLLDEVGAPARGLLDGLIVPDAWYDRAADLAMRNAIDKLWLGEMPDLGKKLGARVAQSHDKWYMRPLLTMGGPGMIFARAATLYNDYYQGGTMSVLEKRMRGSRLRIDDPGAVPSFCAETFPGFAEEVIRLAGREVIFVRQPVCRFAAAAPASHCEVDIEWR